MPTQTSLPADEVVAVEAFADTVAVELGSTVLTALLWTLVAPIGRSSRDDHHPPRSTH